MPNTVVTLASYRALGAALVDWDHVIARYFRDQDDLVDAALVESDADTVRMFHRHAGRAPGRGSIASAVIGLLQPTCIVTGAVAGGVGGNVLTAIKGGICRGDMMRLGETFDTAPITFVALTVPSPGDLFPGADRRATTELTVSAAELELAVRRDDLD